MGSRKTRRRRCANPDCKKPFRHTRSTRKTCSPACRKAIARQRQRAADQRVAAAKATAEAAAKAEEDAARERLANVLADRARKADAREREAAAREEAEQREVATNPAGYGFGGGYGGFSPAAKPITVTLGRTPTFGDVATPLPPGQRAPWR